MPEFGHWENFYVIVGSAAGALIGLQFVVMTLIAERPSRGAAEAGSAFGTPTIVHFSAVLLLSAILCAPWQNIGSVTAVLVTGGLSGIVYVLLVGRRMRTQGAYRPEFEDWLFHLAIPLAAYATLAASACAVPAHTHEALFGVATATLLLLFAGIHNAWDAVTYHVLVARLKRDAAPDPKRERPE